MALKNRNEYESPLLSHTQTNIPTININVQNISIKLPEIQIISEYPKRTVGFTEAPNLQKNISMNDDDFFAMARGKSKSTIQENRLTEEIPNFEP